jgi:chemotaxis protein methyltransferase CheR
MMAALDDKLVTRFRKLVAAQLGLQFDEGKRDFLADVLRQRSSHNGAAPGAYLSALEAAGGSREELDQLAIALTVTETYFMRNADQFRALVASALPDRLRIRRAERRLQLLSAGCASGEEPYSMAIVLHRHFPETAGWDVRVVALDVNPAMLEKAKAGRYSSWSLRETPADIRDRYFEQRGSHYVLDPAIRSMVSFHQRNMAEEKEIGVPGEFDIIFWRNVLMYLTPECGRGVVERVTRALAPGGYLFLSHAETLRGISTDFHLEHTHETFYYRKSEGRATPESQPAVCLATGSDSGQSISVRAENEKRDSWSELIQQSTDRIQRLSRTCRQKELYPGGLRQNAGQASTKPAELGLILELMREERFADALAILGKLPAGRHDDPDVQLLRAVLLTNCADPADAEAACRAVLSRDDLNAGAHYLVALCRERAGDTAAAREHDRIAVYLDPAFAMPHLHLGLLDKRCGQLGPARAELKRAAALLAREDASRILLFCGGFSRAALLAFIRAEQQTCGGQV